MTLKIKTVTFEVRTRAQTIAQYTNDAQQINSVARRLLRTEIDNSAPQPLELRLMGEHLMHIDTVRCHCALFTQQMFPHEVQQLSSA